MAASSILESIRINNPEFIKQYVNAMETPVNEPELKKRTKTTIIIADETESKRLRELRHKRGNGSRRRVTITVNRCITVLTGYHI